MSLLQWRTASLQFQPIRRPHATTGAKGGAGVRAKQQQPGSLHQSSSSIATATAIQRADSSPDKQQPTTITSTPQQQPAVQPTRLADWVGDDDEDAYLYQDNRPKPERGGRKAKKKREKSQREASRVWDWDDVYDPTLPNVYADYKGSEEQYRDVRDWKARLYYWQLKEGRKEDERRSGNGGMAMSMASAAAGDGWSDEEREFEEEERRNRKAANSTFLAHGVAMMADLSKLTSTQEPMQASTSRRHRLTMILLLLLEQRKRMMMMITITPPTSLSTSQTTQATVTNRLLLLASRNRRHCIPNRLPVMMMSSSNVCNLARPCRCRMCSSRSSWRRQHHRSSKSRSCPCLRL